MTRNVPQSSARQPKNSSSRPKYTQTHIWSSITAGQLNSRSRVNEHAFAPSVLGCDQSEHWEIALFACLLSCVVWLISAHSGLTVWSHSADHDDHTPTQNKKLQNNTERAAPVNLSRLQQLLLKSN